MIILILIDFSFLVDLILKANYDIFDYLSKAYLSDWIKIVDFVDFVNINISFFNFQID